MGSVAHYAAEFHRILMYLPTVTEEDVVDRFCQGLKPKIALQVEIQGPPTLAEAEMAALRVDDIMWRHPGAFQEEGPKRNGQSFKGHHSQRNGNNVEIPSPKVESMEVDAISSRSTKMTQDERTKLIASGACFSCKKRGHLYKDCPQKRQRGNDGCPRPSRGRMGLNTVSTSTDDSN